MPKQKLAPKNTIKYGQKTPPGHWFANGTYSEAAKSWCKDGKPKHARQEATRKNPVTEDVIYVRTVVRVNPSDSESTSDDDDSSSEERRKNKRARVEGGTLGRETHIGNWAQGLVYSQGPAKIKFKNASARLNWDGQTQCLKLPPRPLGHACNNGTGRIRTCASLQGECGEHAVTTGPRAFYYLRAM